MKEKIYALFIGLFSTLIVLEIALRLFGFITQSTLLGKQGESGEYTILCMGNSFTLGLGAQQGQSYPDHLQALVDDQFPNIDIKVINDGEAGINSAGILEQLDSRIDRYNPDMIILRAGSPNIRNQRKFSNYITREGGNISWFELLWFRIKDLFYGIRIVRLVDLVADDWERKKIESRRDHTRHMTNDEQVQHIRRLTKPTEKVSELRKLGDEARNVDDYEGSMAFVVEAMKENKGKFRQLRIDVFRFQNLARFVPPKVTKQYIKEVRRFDKDTADMLLNVRINELGKWLRSDLEEIIRVVEEKDITLVMQNYPILGRNTLPGRELEWIKIANAVLRDCAKDHDILFIDNESLYTDRSGYSLPDLRDEQYPPIPSNEDSDTTDLSSKINQTSSKKEGPWRRLPSGLRVLPSRGEYHPNGKGYKYMAQLLLKLIKPLIPMK